MALSAQNLSGSTDGRGIKIAASSTPGTAIHTADASAQDEVWLWVMNSDSVARVVSIEFGGTTDPDDLIEHEIPAGEMHLVVPGIRITNSLAVAAFGAAANVLVAFGHVNRIS